jgi:hypothetical protein
MQFPLYGCSQSNVQLAKLWKGFLKIKGPVQYSTTGYIHGRVLRGIIESIRCFLCVLTILERSQPSAAGDKRFGPFVFRGPVTSIQRPVMVESSGAMQNFRTSACFFPQAGMALLAIVPTLPAARFVEDCSEVP